jgi:hypothetical protein
MEFEIRVERNPYQTGVSLFGSTHKRDSVLRAKPLAMETVEEGLLFDPFAKLSNTATQLLIDELWRCGYRPSIDQDKNNSLAATEKHLNDMRKIVSHKLKVEL